MLQKPGPGTVSSDELEARIAAAVAGERLLALSPVTDSQGQEKQDRSAGQGCRCMIPGSDLGACNAKLVVRTRAQGLGLRA